MGLCVPSCVSFFVVVCTDIRIVACYQIDNYGKCHKILKLAASVRYTLICRRRLLCCASAFTSLMICGHTTPRRQFISPLGQLTRIPVCDQHVHAVTRCAVASPD